MSDQAEAMLEPTKEGEGALSVSIYPSTELTEEDTDAKNPKGKKGRASKTVFAFIYFMVVVVVAVIVGVVTWKLTRDSFGHEAGGRVQGGATASPKPGIIDLGEEEDPVKYPWQNLRLNPDIQPVHYDISLFPDFYNGRGEFYGNLTLTLQISKATKVICIHLHTDYINVTRINLTRHDSGEVIPLKRSFIYKPNEFLVLELETEVKDLINISFQFYGTLIKGILGLYKSSYVLTTTKKTKYFVATIFQPTLARRAFPCLDEPAMKAGFTVTLIHRPKYTALSNMPQQGKSLPVPWSSGDLVATKFQRSVRMSTYLVSFVVCDFLYKKTTGQNGVPIRVFSTPDKINQVDYALKVSRLILDYFEDLFNLTYPLPKLDLIAIPDFAAGAMEHWGIIAYRETALLYDKNQAPLVGKERVLKLVAHEIAHMWFGNIVTNAWWNDLWLNEGFATYMEYVGPNQIEKDWDVMSQFLIKAMFPVMNSDAGLSSHPIVVEVFRPAEISSVFDSISYQKGASVIRMLASIMGKEKFYKGINAYLKKYQLGSANTDDLWECFHQVDPGMEVKAVMDTWTLQDGYPYVKVSWVTAGNGVTSISAKQTRFLSDPNATFDPATSPFNYKWYIFLDYFTSKGANGSAIMDKDNVTFRSSFSPGSPNEWIKFNTNEDGFYRVLYPVDMWNRFSQYLMATEASQWTLSTADRSGLLSDAFNLASSGLLDYAIPLQLASYLHKETDFVPWATAINHGLSYVTKQLMDKPAFTLWKSFVLRNIRPTLLQLGFKDEGSHLERRLRVLLFNMACWCDDQDALKVVTSQFRNWLDNEIKPSVNLRRIVYGFGMATAGTDADFDMIWEKYNIEPSPQEKETLGYALAQTTKHHLMARLLQYAKLGEGIKQQDFFTIVHQAGQNLAMRDMVWTWMQTNYKDFEQRFSVKSYHFGRMAHSLTRLFNTPLRLQQVKDFFAKHPNAGSSKRYRKMALDEIQMNINWLDKFRQPIVKWVEDEEVKSHSKFGSLNV